MTTHPTSIQKRLARQIAQLYRTEVLETDYKFNHVDLYSVTWAKTYNMLFECNGFFPKKNGYSYDDKRQTYNGGSGHPDDKHTFFFWKHYNTITNIDDPDYLHSWHEQYILDGTSNYWIGGQPNYNDYCLESMCDYFIDFSTQSYTFIPFEVCTPDDETPTDRFRRYNYYTQNLCSWALKDCYCNANGCPCNKVESERFGYEIGSITYN
jgi:hypothetical protein